MTHHEKMIEARNRARKFYRLADAEARCVGRTKHWTWLKITADAAWREYNRLKRTTEPVVVAVQRETKELHDFINRATTTIMTDGLPHVVPSSFRFIGGPKHGQAARGHHRYFFVPVRQLATAEFIYEVPTTITTVTYTRRVICICRDAWTYTEDCLVLDGLTEATVANLIEKDLGFLNNSK